MGVSAGCPHTAHKGEWLGTTCPLPFTAASPLSCGSRLQVGAMCVGMVLHGRLLPFYDRLLGSSQSSLKAAEEPPGPVPRQQ